MCRKVMNRVSKMILDSTFNHSGTLERSVKQ